MLRIKKSIIFRRRLSSYNLPLNYGSGKALSTLKISHVETEDILIAKTDPIGLISIKYNPAVIRAFKAYSDQPSQSNLALHDAFCKTEDVLVYLNRTIPRVPLQSLFRGRLPWRIEHIRRFLGLQCLKILNELDSEHDVRSLAAFMAILLPRSEKAWVLYDEAMHYRLSKKFDVETGLLCSYALTSAASALRFPGEPFKTPNTVLNAIIQQHQMQNTQNRPKQKVQQKQKQASNMFDIVLDSSRGISGDSSSTTKGAFSEAFAPIGSSQVQDCPSIEQLGLLLHLLAHASSYATIAPPATAAFSSGGGRSRSNCGGRGGAVQRGRQSLRQAPGFKRLLGQLTDFGTRVLGEVHSPVKFGTLKVLWEAAPGIELPNAYEFYKKLYEQVTYSVAAAPLQLVREEQSICALLAAMAQCKYKSGQLVQLLFQISAERGMRFTAAQASGLQMFNTLIELDALPFAMHVLEGILRDEELSFSTGLAQMPYSLSNDARKLVYNRLMSGAATHDSSGGGGAAEMVPLYALSRAGPSYRHFDLLIALLTFNWASKGSAQYRLLEDIERDLLRGIEAHPSSSAIVDSYCSGSNDCTEGAFSCPTDGSVDSVGSVDIKSSRAWEATSSALVPMLMPAPEQLALSTAEVVSVMHCYAVVGRFNPDVLRAVDPIVAAYLQAGRLDAVQQARLLWAAARLNHTTAPYLEDLCRSCVEQHTVRSTHGAICTGGINSSSRSGHSRQHKHSATNSNKLNVQRMFDVTRKLWALAVLERLDHETFLALSDALIVDPRRGRVRRGTHVPTEHDEWSDAVKVSAPPPESSSSSSLSRSRNRSKDSSTGSVMGVGEGGWEMNPISTQQLIQVWAELELVYAAKKDSITGAIESIGLPDNLTTSSGSTAAVDGGVQQEGKATSSQSDLKSDCEVEQPMLLIQLKVQQELAGQLQQDLAVLEGQHAEVRQLLEAVLPAQRRERFRLRHRWDESSHTHAELSQVLSDLAVAHENEKPLQFGYVADVFIPPPSTGSSNSSISGGGGGGGGGGFGNQGGSGALGTVVEYDGPSHFESYLERPLGPTAMKHRHLEGLGYRLVSVPFRAFNLSMTRDQRVAALRKRLRNGAP